MTTSTTSTKMDRRFTSVSAIQCNRQIVWVHSMAFHGQSNASEKSYVRHCIQWSGFNSWKSHLQHERMCATMHYGNCWVAKTIKLLFYIYVEMSFAQNGKTPNRWNDTNGRYALWVHTIEVNHHSRSFHTHSFTHSHDIQEWGELITCECHVLNWWARIAFKRCKETDFTSCETKNQRWFCMEKTVSLCATSRRHPLISQPFLWNAHSTQLNRFRWAEMVCALVCRISNFRINWQRQLGAVAHKHRPLLWPNGNAKCLCDMCAHAIKTNAKVKHLINYLFQN